MKILLIHNYYQYPGGEKTYFESLVRLLRKKGHKVIVYTKSNKNISSIQSKTNTAIGLFYNKPVEKELSNIIKNHKPDIAQFQNIYPLITPIAYKILKRYKVPIIQRISNYRLLCPKGILFRNGKICELCLNKKLKYPAIIHSCYQKSRIASFAFSMGYYYHLLLSNYNLIDHYIFPSNFIRNYHLKYTNIPQSKVSTIYTFTDIHKIKNSKKYSKSIVKKKDYFIYCGQFTEQKGIMSLLKVFSKLPNLKLVAFGDGPLAKEVYKYAKYANIEIRRWQKRSIIKAYLQRAIATIIPSLWFDVLPNILLESLACKTPVIAPKKGVFLETITDGKTGLLYQNLTPDVIIQAQKVFKINSVNIKQQVYNNYISKHHEDIHYKKLLKLYRSLKTVK